MTHKKIAEIAHVSLSTVSKALSGSREVSDELREKIIKIAVDCGYFAEKGRRKIEYTGEKDIIIAIICPEIISVSYAGEITAIKKELEKRGAFAAVYVYDFDDEKLNRIIKNITVGNCADGIILFHTPSITESRSIPTVCISTPANDCDTVLYDINACFFDIVSYLKDLGHKNIAFVGEPRTEIKLNSYKAALAAHGLTYKDENIFIVKERFEGIGYEAANQIMKKEVLPTAIICAYDEIALSLIHILTENGIDVPNEISVVGINDIPMAAYSTVPLTTVRIFENEQAKIAVKLLYDKIFDKSEVIQHITIEHQLIKRKSTAERKRDS